MIKGEKIWKISLKMQKLKLLYLKTWVERRENCGKAISELYLEMNMSRDLFGTVWVNRYVIFSPYIFRWFCLDFKRSPEVQHHLVTLKWPSGHQNRSVAGGQVPEYIVGAIPQAMVCLILILLSNEKIKPWLVQATVLRDTLLLIVHILFNQFQKIDFQVFKD